MRDGLKFDIKFAFILFLLILINIILMIVFAHFGLYVRFI